MIKSVLNTSVHFPHWGFTFNMYYTIISKHTKICMGLCVCQQLGCVWWVWCTSDTPAIQAQLFAKEKLDVVKLRAGITTTKREHNESLKEIPRVQNIPGILVRFITHLKSSTHIRVKQSYEYMLSSIYLLLIEYYWDRHRTITLSHIKPSNANTGWKCMQVSMSMDIMHKSMQGRSTLYSTKARRLIKDYTIIKFFCKKSLDVGMDL